MNNWKQRDNDLSKLTVKELIENTIREEINQVRIETQLDRNLCSTAYASMDKQIEQEGYYRALYLLNQLL